ncbi:MAG: HTTM domain-containing protein [Pirellulaceae bacterium]|jgi:uncharacterized membrane protein YphA (DoxX/SURF4 family)|nr:HTTM domain-containing protein [Pirellulaceae bacterium]MDP7020378.1 HTTM domain-containing protein [Pirellulaceae bacterium]
MISSNTARSWWTDVSTGWERFWFTPAEPHTLAAIRILAGGMLLYTHLVWTLNLTDFLGPASWISRDAAAQLNAGTTAWSPFFYTDSPAAVWALHLFTLIVGAMLLVGYQTRIAAVLTWVMTISYCHRLQGSLFGLDQVNAMFAMYLMIGPSGAVYSIDAWLAARRGVAKVDRTVGANIAIRLLQLHMCIIYLFGGIGKMRGEMWWNGLAFWYSISNLEYQSLDVTWLVRFPIVIAVVTHVTVLWETFYCFLVWPRRSRPVVLGLAVVVHGGIAIALGMITFGIAMLVGNLSFIQPATIQSIVARMSAQADRLRGVITGGPRREPFAAN